MKVLKKISHIVSREVLCSPTGMGPRLTFVPPSLAGLTVARNPSRHPVFGVPQHTLGPISLRRGEPHL